MNRRLWLLAGVAAAGSSLALLGAGVGLAQTPPPTATPPAAAPPTVTALSPEEALISVLPYKLQPADTPAGFHILTAGATTPEELAYDIGIDESDSQDVLTVLQQGGYQITFSQDLIPDAATPVRVFAYKVTLLTTSQNASAFMHDALEGAPTSDTAVDNPPVTVRLGDESGALHEVITRADSNNEQHENLLWRRGRIVFSLELQTLDSTESLDQVTSLAQTVDAHAATIAPPAPTTQATRPAFGTESYRVSALYALADRLTGSAQTPIGLISEGGDILNNADIVLQAKDSDSMYTKVAQSWKRITGVETVYDTLQADAGETLTVQYSLCADMAGARGFMLDPDRRANGQSFTMYGLPQLLGDDGRLYYETYTTSKGVPAESWRAIWLRGPVVLSVTGTGPTGTVTAQAVAAFAAIVDARYNRGALPDILTVPLPANSSPTPATPTPQPSATPLATVPASLPPISTPTPLPITR